MKRLQALVIFLFMCSGMVSAKVDNADLDNIRDLTNAGQYEQALEKHLWFHEESKSSSGMGGVRLSYAITAWVELGKKYPPALDALIKVRDRDKGLLLSGEGEFDNFHDLSAINRGLGKDDETIELFLTLDKKFPEESGAYYIVAEDLLIENKYYEICSKYIGDPIFKYEGLRHAREVQLSFSKTTKELNTPRFLKYTDERFVEGVVKLIEVLLAIDKRDDAIEVRKRALSYYDSEDIKHAIQ